MEFSIEHETAERLQQVDELKRRVAVWESQDRLNAAHYELREEIRCAVLRAIDEVTESRTIENMSDAELPALFRALDPIAERVFLKSVGL